MYGSSRRTKENDENGSSTLWLDAWKSIDIGSATRSYSSHRSRFLCLGSDVNLVFLVFFVSFGRGHTRPFSECRAKLLHICSRFAWTSIGFQYPSSPSNRIKPKSEELRSLILMIHFLYSCVLSRIYIYIPAAQISDSPN
jgi:hypothetical protein